MKDKRHNKHKYSNKDSSSSIFKDGHHFKGILVTCDAKKEKFAVRDAYRIINDFIEKYRVDKIDLVEDDLDKAIEAKINNMNGDKPAIEEGDAPKPKREFMSQQVQIKGKGLVFIKLNNKLLVPEFEVEKLALEVLEDAHSRHEKLSKDIFRFVPVEVACLASSDNFQTFMGELVAKKMPESETHHTWSLVYKCRNNSKFAKFEFLDFLDGAIPKNYRRIDYNGDYNVIVDITQHFMCLTISTHFLEYNKFSMSRKEKKEEADEKQQTPDESLSPADKEMKIENEDIVKDVVKVDGEDEAEKSDIDLF